MCEGKAAVRITFQDIATDIRELKPSRTGSEEYAEWSIQLSRAEVTTEARKVIRAALGQRSICLIAPYFDRFFLPIIDQLNSAGTEVRGIIAADSDSKASATVRIPLMDFSMRNHPLPHDRFEFIFEDPPQMLRSWLHEIDPSDDMYFLGSQFTDVSQVCGRPVYAWRRPQWADWEDKTLVDRKLETIGIAVPPHAIHSSRDPALRASFTRLDSGLGVVIAACATRAERGGGSSLSIARTGQEFGRIISMLGEKAATVRVSQFVAGVPSSVIGMVANKRVFVFDPIEIVTLFDRAAGRFVFCGSSTYWRPLGHIAREMQSVAARVGFALAQISDFSGGFSVDGIVAGKRFLTTEVNARHASGLGLSRIWPDFPMYLFSRCLVEGGPPVELIDMDRFVRVARDAVYQAPSFSVLVPKLPDRIGERTIALQVADEGIGVRCLPSVNGRRARIGVIDEFPASTLMGPIAAALAARLGKPELVSPIEMDNTEVRVRSDGKCL